MDEISTIHNGDISVDDFKKVYGEDFSNAVNIDTWHLGENLAELYQNLERELVAAKKDELQTHRAFREKIFPAIKNAGNTPQAGLHTEVNSESVIEKIHAGFLFNGAVTACGSVSAIFDTVPVSITQIGVCLVNYQGQHGSYSHRFFRRDLRYKGEDPLQEALDLIERRRGNDFSGESKSKLSNLAIRGIKAYAEKAILLEKSQSTWLMGTGSPTPYELMTGFWASRKEMKDRSISLMKKMVTEHKRFVYVQNSDHNKELWTLGNALLPLEFLVLDTMEDNLKHMVASGGTRGDFRSDYEKFASEIGSQIVYGVYRVSKLAPPKIFYSHIDHIQTAAAIAMADSALQLHVGAPMLLDLADSLCKSAFGKTDFIASIEQAYMKTEVLLGL